jgi:transcriptional regulator with XRE-family HTH domain
MHVAPVVIATARELGGLDVGGGEPRLQAFMGCHKGVVTDTTLVRNTPRCIFSNAAPSANRANWGMAAKPTHRVTYIRQWRNHRGYSLDQLAARVPMDKGNLSKVERGILPYNQELLERLADALMTDPASLLMRDPSQADAIWSLWDSASAGEKREIESIAAALIRAKRAA